MKDTCGSEFTYVINGHVATFMGEGNLHDPEYTDVNQTYGFAHDIMRVEQSRADGNISLYCDYTLTAYASATFQAAYVNSTPAIYTAVVVMVFFFTIVSTVLH
jgi:hypothetical protein